LRNFSNFINSNNYAASGIVFVLCFNNLSSSDYKIIDAEIKYIITLQINNSRQNKIILTIRSIATTGLNVFGETEFPFDFYQRSGERLVK